MCFVFQFKGKERQPPKHLMTVENGLEHIEKAITDGSGKNIIRKL